MSLLKVAPDAPVYPCLSCRTPVIDKDKFNCSHKRSPPYSALTVDTRGGSDTLEFVVIDRDKFGVGEDLMGQ